MTMTHLASCFHVGHFAAPFEDPMPSTRARDLNRVAKWIRLRPRALKHVELEPPTKPVRVSDSSVSAGDAEGFAMRCRACLLVEDRDSSGPRGRARIGDLFARERPPVCQGTH